MSNLDGGTMAGAVGAKTARACDSCLRRRARWYCAADDAFLCQACDNSVHSANQLARRHERVRLKTSSSSTFKTPVIEDDDVVADPTAPTWHRAVKRKARTPRGHKQSKSGEQQQQQGRMWPVVPDLEAVALEEGGDLAEEEEEEEEQLIYRVPIFDPVLSEFCSQPAPYDNGYGAPAADEAKPVAATAAMSNGEGLASGFLPSDRDMAEFAMDVESLLGRGFDQDSFSIDELGLMGSRDGSDGGSSHYDSSCMSFKDKVKKEEANDDDKFGFAEEDMDLSDVKFDINFDYSSPQIGGEASVPDGKKRRIMLRLDYEAVINSWSSQGSPWADGERPRFDIDDCWPDNLELMLGGGEVPIVGGQASGTSSMVDVGREARVSRYREKRRTRLFSKKIRYEVRKLNAEKRPRMKGRFVKRTSFAGVPTTTSVAGAIAGPVPPQFVY